MNSRFSLVPVDEPDAPASADQLGMLLAASPAWIGPFIVFLDGLDFDRVPSMTPGATFFEGATRGDPHGRQIISALDDVYRDVRDGEEAAAVHGHILERFVRHSLAHVFTGPLGACELHCDGSPQARFRLDAATHSTPPCAGVEAKTSTRALRKRGEQRAQAKLKAIWVVSLLDTTGGHVSGVWATWIPAEKFRSALETLIGADAGRALIVAHEQLRQLPQRLQALVTAQAKAAEQAQT
jgi:hypothetical protein